MKDTTNRIVNLFRAKQNDILSLYFTAGFPDINSTVEIIKAIEEAGGDMVEIGIPFSDPLADGPVIQRSSEIALKNGMSMKLLFEQLRTANFQPDSYRVPTLLMGYMNPVLQFGVERFCRECEATGIDGVIIPDLPAEEFLKNYKDIFRKYGVLNVFLITPQTSVERIHLIDKHSKGFIYAVSSSTTTGMEKRIDRSFRYFAKIKKMGLSHPSLIGFNVKDRASFKYACRYANGAIIGSAFINAIGKGGNLKKNIKEFIADVLGKKQSHI